MNKLKHNIKLIFIVFSCLFLSLIVYLTYFTVYERENLVKNSYNLRLWEQEEKVLRGGIYDREGRPLAESGVEKDKKRRIYSGGEAIGPILGYSDRTLGRAGIESVFNGELLGLSEKDPMVFLRQKILGVGERGNDLHLTIDLNLQNTAYKAFKGRKGALVAIDPNTGEILAMVSSPGFNPTNLKEDWDKISKDSNNPLINRATQGLYPPGSVFKVITLAAALTHNPEIETKIYYTPGYIKVSGSIIRDGEHLWPGEFDLSTAFRYSSNTVFIQIGQEVETEKMISTIEAFGFNNKTKADIPVAQSSFPRPSIIGGNVEMAEAFIGQGKLLTTPLQMARVTSIIANGGKNIDPYIVKEVVTPLGVVKKKGSGGSFDTVIEKRVADKINTLMVDVVKNGTGKSADIWGIDVAGKTGSAENPHGRAHAWFIGFAPADNPEIAVAVIVENAGGGGANAGPIARDIMEQYIKNNLSNDQTR